MLARDGASDDLEAVTTCAKAAWDNSRPRTAKDVNACSAHAASRLFPRWRASVRVFYPKGRPARPRECDNQSVIR